MTRRLRMMTALLALPVAFFAVVVLRGAPPRKFWRLYWEEASDGK